MHIRKCLVGSKVLPRVKDAITDSSAIVSVSVLTGVLDFAPAQMLILIRFDCEMFFFLVYLLFNIKFHAPRHILKYCK